MLHENKYQMSDYEKSHWSCPVIDWLHHILKKYDVLYETNIVYFFYFSSTLYHVIHNIRNALLNKNKRFNFAINKTELKAFSVFFSQVASSRMWSSLAVIYLAIEELFRPSKLTTIAPTSVNRHRDASQLKQ
jgi:hypothetical protein